MTNSNSDGSAVHPKTPWSVWGGGEGGKKPCSRFLAETAKSLDLVRSSEGLLARIPPLINAYNNYYFYTTRFIVRK